MEESPYLLGRTSKSTRRDKASPDQRHASGQGHGLGNTTAHRDTFLASSPHTCTSHPRCARSALHMIGARKKSKSSTAVG